MLKRKQAISLKYFDILAEEFKILFLFVCLFEKYGLNSLRCNFFV